MSHPLSLPAAGLRGLVAATALLCLFAVGLIGLCADPEGSEVAVVACEEMRLPAAGREVEPTFGLIALLFVPVVLARLPLPVPAAVAPPPVFSRREPARAPPAAVRPH